MNVLGHEVEILSYDIVYHGDAITLRGLRNGIRAVAAHAQRFTDSIKEGLRLLTSGAPGPAHDVRPIAGAPVETFQYFSAATGEHVLAWRVACQETAP